LRYLDTGAMYRAVAWLALRQGVSPDDATAVTGLADAAELLVSTDPSAPAIGVGGTDLTQLVRSAEVTAAVSAVSAIPGVRVAMVGRQREIIGDGGIVVEGRDIGTTVAPDAAVKVFLTADAAARALRRADQDGRGRDGSVIASTEAELTRRDAADSSRVASPLTQAPDALVIDSTALSAAEVIEQIVEHAAALT
jgi:cytidylate kinase